MTAPDKIKRYDAGLDGSCYVDASGAFVAYDDHQSALAERDATIARLQARLDAGPSAADVRQWGQMWCWPRLLETANRMEALNDK